MKFLLFPFKKGSFWVILAASYLIIVLFPVVEGRIVSEYLKRGWDYTSWKLLFSIKPDESISMKWLIFEGQFVFFLNYLGHLVFSHRDIEG
jgi:hypothetical protein